MIKALLRAWDRFFFSRFDPASLAMLRIFVGVLWLVLLSYMSFNWERYYGAEGIIGYHDPALWQDPFSGMNWTEGKLNIWVWWYAGMAGGVLFTIGLFTRTMTVLLWFISSSIVLRNLIVVGGEDLVLRMTLWWCMFLPLGRAGSVDAWIRARRLRGAPDPRPQPRIWALRLLQLNVLCIYTCSLPLKLTTDPAWLNGDAFFFAIVNDTWSRWPWPEMFFTKWMSMLGTYSAVLMEGSIAILVWTRWRLWALGVMAIFHVMLGLMLNHVGFFSLATGVTLWSFVPGEWTRAQWQTLRAFCFRRSAHADAVSTNRGSETPAADAVG